MDITTLFYWIDHLGVAVFAISGALLAFRKKMDGFGILVLATVTAIGGGTIRDLIIDLPVFWTRDTFYLYTILATSLLTIVWLRYKHYIHKTTLLVADAFGVAFFTVMGAQRALEAGFSPLICIIMGTITACFGGMLRDVLARDIPMVLKSELYAVTCIAGGSVFVLIAPYSSIFAITCGGLTTLLLRLGAIKWHWSFLVLPDQQDGSR